MKERRRAGMAEGLGTVTPSPLIPPSSHLDMFTNLEAIEILFFLVIMEASLHRHDLLNQLPLVTDSTSTTATVIIQEK